MHNHALLSFYSVILVMCLALPTLPANAQVPAPNAVPAAESDDAATPPAASAPPAEATHSTTTYEERVERAVEQAQAAAVDAQKSKEGAVRNVLSIEEMIKQQTARVSALKQEAESKQQEYNSLMESAKKRLAAEIDKAKLQAAEAVETEIKKLVEATKQMMMQQMETQIEAIAEAQLNHAVKTAEESAIKVVTAKFAEAQAIQDYSVQSKVLAEQYQQKIQQAKDQLETAKADKMQAIQSVLAKETAAKVAVAKYEAAKAAADKFHAEKEAARLEAIRRAAEQFDKEIQQAGE